jgi:hypothetical protein
LAWLPLTVASLVTGGIGSAGPNKDDAAKLDVFDARCRNCGQTARVELKSWPIWRI